MDDLKNVFDKIEKAESILNELDRKRTDKAIEKDAYDILSKDQQNTINSARQSIASIKEKLSKELASSTLELDKCQEDLILLQTRLKVGEISHDTYRAKSKHLLEKIKALEKKIIETQGMIDARFAKDIVPVIESNSTASGLQPASDEQTEEKIFEVEGAETKNGQEKSVQITEPVKNGVEINGHRPSFHLHPHSSTVSGKLQTAMPDIAKKNRILATVIAVFFLALLLCGAIVFYIPRSGPNVGNTAPDFVMQIGDNNTSALSSLRGKNVILVFWDRDFWDSQFFDVNGVTRKLYTPDKLNQIYQKYPHSELSIIAVASGTNNNEIDKLTKDYEINFPIIVDSFGKLRSSYNISYEPTYIFLDKNGVIRARIEGPIVTMSDLEQIVYSVTQNTEIKQTKPPITEVLVQSITEKSAVLNWSTDKPTTTQVDIDGKNIETVISQAPITLHSLTLRDLEPNASYHIRIVYNINNINVSEHSFSALMDTIVSKRYQVTTSSKDTSNPEISNISTSFVADSSTTVTWKTDEPTTGEVDYRIDKDYIGTANQGGKLSIWHTVKVDGLKPDTQYYLKLRSKDSSGKETVQEIEPIKTQSLVETAPMTDKRAPNFSLFTIDGTNVTLSQFLGHRVLLNFWLEGCSACQAEMPLLQKAYNKYNRDQLIILAVNVQGDQDKVSYYVGSEKLTFPILLDSEGNVDSIYKPPFFPTTFFIDSKGIIRQIVTERFQTISEIDAVLDKLN